MKLTKTVVEKLPVPDKGEKHYFDDELKGFGVRITAKGTRSYFAQGRPKGQVRRFTIGQHGMPISESEILTADKARKRAMGLIAGFRDGIDPVIEKERAQTLAVTLQDVCEVYCKERRTKKGGELTPRTKADIARHVKVSFADWKDKPIVNITRDLCSKRFTEMSAKGATQANQAFRILRALLNYASEKYRPGDVPILLENPVRVVSGLQMWNPNNARNGRIPIGSVNSEGKVVETCKVGEVWNLLQHKRKSDAVLPSGKAGADIVLFLLLTGCRWSEAAQLTWDRVNLDAGSWYLPDPKNHKPITLPLSKPLREILKARPGTKDNPYVFPSRLKDTGGFLNNAHPTFKEVSMVAGLHLTPHDMRRTFIQIGHELKIEMWRLALLTNHRNNNDVMLKNYSETESMLFLSGEVETIAAWIVKQGKIASAGNIVQLRKKKTAA